jgi:hypothetical protein
MQLALSDRAQRWTYEREEKPLQTSAHNSHTAKHLQKWRPVLVREWNIETCRRREYPSTSPKRQQAPKATIEDFKRPRRNLAMPRIPSPSYSRLKTP